MVSICSSCRAGSSCGPPLNRRTGPVLDSARATHLSSPSSPPSRSATSSCRLLPPWPPRVRLSPAFTLFSARVRLLLASSSCPLDPALHLLISVLPESAPAPPLHPTTSQPSRKEPASRRLKPQSRKRAKLDTVLDPFLYSASTASSIRHTLCACLPASSRPHHCVILSLVFGPKLPAVTAT